MTQRETRSTYITEIDILLREIMWFAQKQTMHLLADPAIGLTLPQMITLFAIDERGTCRMTDLAEHTQQSAGTLTGIVDRLIQDGLVSRVRNADDRRVVEVTLTPEGESRLQRVSQSRAADTERMLNEFNDQDLRACESLLHRLREELQHQNGCVPQPS